MFSGMFAPCSLVEVYRPLKGACASIRSMISLMTEPESTSETSLKFYQTTRRNSHIRKRISSEEKHQIIWSTKPSPIIKDVPAAYILSLYDSVPKETKVAGNHFSEFRVTTVAVQSFHVTACHLQSKAMASFDEKILPSFMEPFFM
jgi:hypothetical protein